MAGNSDRNDFHRKCCCPWQVISSIRATSEGDRWNCYFREYGLSKSTIAQMVRAYGASGHEGAVRDQVKKLLPEWAQKRITEDAAGNLVLHLGDGKRDVKTPSIAFVAHMDELGFEVQQNRRGRAATRGVFGWRIPAIFSRSCRPGSQEGWHSSWRCDGIA